MEDLVQNFIVVTCFCLAVLIPTWVYYFSRRKRDCSESARRMDRNIFLFGTLFTLCVYVLLLLAVFGVL